MKRPNRARAQGAIDMPRIDPAIYTELSLFPQHGEMLADSAVSLEVAKARGYESIDKKVRLEELGFGGKQRRENAKLWRVPLIDLGHKFFAKGGERGDGNVPTWNDRGHG